jgi:hypothetical protein
MYWQSDEGVPRRFLISCPTWEGSSELALDFFKIGRIPPVFAYRSAVAILKNTHVSGRNKARVTFPFSFYVRKRRKGKNAVEKSNMSKWKQFLSTLLPSRCSFTPFSLSFFFFYCDFTFYSVPPFYERCGWGGGWRVFNSFPLRKQSDKTKTEPHISFIVSSSSIPSSVYSEYKINTDGIEQWSL